MTSEIYHCQTWSSYAGHACHTEGHDTRDIPLSDKINIRRTCLSYRGSGLTRILILKDHLSLNEFIELVWLFHRRNTGNVLALLLCNLKELPHMFLYQKGELYVFLMPHYRWGQRLTHSSGKAPHIIEKGLPWPVCSKLFLSYSERKLKWRSFSVSVRAQVWNVRVHVSHSSIIIRSTPLIRNGSLL